MLAMSQEFGAKLRSLDNPEARRAAQDEFQQQQDAAQKKTRDFYQTDAGREYCFSKHRYALNFATNGAFRMEDDGAH